MRLPFHTERPASGAAFTKAAPLLMCAGHERQLGGESPLPILTEEKG